jgi:hypothetical protein
MTETLESSVRIDDPAIVWDVAHSAHYLRTMAAAKRQIDKAAMEANEPRQDTLIARSILGIRIVKLTEIYPELIAQLELQPNDADDDPLNYRQVNRLSSEIYSKKGLPPYRFIIDGEVRDEDDLDLEASRLEDATAAMLLSPPSQDFLRDYELGRPTDHEDFEDIHEREISANEIAHLPVAANNFEALLARIVADSERTKKQFQMHDSENATHTKRQAALRMLRRVTIWSVDETFAREFEAQAVSVAANEDFTIDDLVVLYESGINYLATIVSERAKKQRGLYIAIISGAAAEYTSNVA